MGRLGAALAVLAIFAAVGTADYVDAKQTEAHYCEMVKAKAWPDYLGTYEKECKKVGRG